MTHEPGEPTAVAQIDPNNPPWGLTTAVLTWLGSVLLLVSVQFLIVIPYVLYRNPSANGEPLTQFLARDPSAIFLQIISTIPAHLLTIGLVWAMVTGFGKRPFWQTLGWSWGKNFGLWRSISAAILLLIFGLILTHFMGGDQTQLDQIINSSTAARYTTVFLATFTAPLVEELIYRGVLYSALQRTIGMLWAVVGVSVLFMIVHVPQYQTNIGVISAIGVLSLFLTLVRAYTGRLLPCVIIHTVFNGLQAILIILEPYMQRPETGEQKAAAIELLTSAMRSLI
jgi:membrane protease YdiL (CAAX protease family)